MTILITGSAGIIDAAHIFCHMDKYPEDKVVRIDKHAYAGNLSAYRNQLKDVAEGRVKY